MKKLKYVLFPVILIVLTSCFNFGDLFNSSSEKPVTQSILDSNDNNYIHPNVDPNLNYYQAVTNPYDNKHIGNSKDVSLLSSVGDQKLLVIPVSFLNSPAKYRSQNERVKTSLTKAFFGASNETGWESVSSFYGKSSYGKLNLTGEVVNTIHLNYTTSEFQDLEIDDRMYWDQTHYALEDIYEGSSLTSAKLREYDQDNDGYVDAVFLVYLAPVGEDVFWAYQYYWNRYPWDSAAENNRPAFNTYAWASYEFMFEDDNYSEEEPAAHTFIHETGHMFGLDDYYDYDSKTAPVGGIDMMDNNIIDHNMYSKFLLNWALPYVPVGDSEIYLRPAQSSGDFILINNNWNGHAYDEYILIEYYTPTGLNKHDSMGAGYGKAGNRVIGFGQAGVRIYHVDSRVAEIRFNSRGEARAHQFRDTLDTISPQYYFDYVASNTLSDGFVEDAKKLHLLDGGGRSYTWYHTLGTTTNIIVLFQSEQEIKSTEWKKYLFSDNTFNDKTSIGYSVLIGDMDENGVTIKLTAA